MCKWSSDPSSACYFPQQCDKCMIYSNGTVAVCWLLPSQHSILLLSRFPVTQFPDGAPPSCLVVEGCRKVRQSELMLLYRRPAWPHLRVGCSLKGELGILRL